MKRTKFLLYLFALVLAALVMSGCGCEHEWVEATCLAPRTCSKCGDYSGKTTDHNWLKATCEAPKTCSVCGLTEGEMLEHKWQNATCTAPQTCSICGDTKGDVAHKWTKATCVSPATCSVCGLTNGGLADHQWSKATCVRPKTCSVCKLTEGEKEEHDWSAATCTRPKTCYKCGASEGEKINHTWVYRNSTTPTTCSQCGEMQPLSTPYNGQVFYGANLARYGELTIHNDGNGCYVKLKTASKKDVFAFYVQANTTCTINVPTGNYYVYFASGKDWYGPEYCFGDETAYSMDDEILDFTNYSWEYTLTPVVNGNLTLDDIPASEF